jgi:hypothetical protein
MKWLSGKSNKRQQTAKLYLSANRLRRTPRLATSARPTPKNRQGIQRPPGGSFLIHLGFFLAAIIPHIRLKSPLEGRRTAHAIPSRIFLISVPSDNAVTPSGGKSTPPPKVAIGHVQPDSSITKHPI